jgi:ketosteroid isomerase-like protein
MLRSYERGGPEAIIDFLAPDAVFVVPPEVSTEPDVYSGHDGARRYFAGFVGAIDGVAFDLDEIEEVAPGALLARVTLRGVGAVSRIPVEQATYMTLQVRNGLVHRIAAHGDLASAQREIDAAITEISRAPEL